MLARGNAPGIEDHDIIMRPERATLNGRFSLNSALPDPKAVFQKTTLVVPAEPVPDLIREPGIQCKTTQSPLLTQWLHF